MAPTLPIDQVELGNEERWGGLTRLLLGVNSLDPCVIHTESQHRVTKLGFAKHTHIRGKEDIIYSFNFLFLFFFLSFQML